MKYNQAVASIGTVTIGLTTVQSSSVSLFWQISQDSVSVCTKQRINNSNQHREWLTLSMLLDLLASVSVSSAWLDHSGFAVYITVNYYHTHTNSTHYYTSGHNQL